MIAKQFLIPKELENHGLKKEDIRFQGGALKGIIDDYTKEAGLRNLDREIATICRKVAKKVASGNKRKVLITQEALENFLGPVKFFREKTLKKPRVGVIPSLAWTQFGGEILFVEATKMPGRKSLTLTGNLGEVMKESVQTALSYVRSNSEKLGLPKNFFDRLDIHVHVPSGAIPKDGPSAGVTMATALASLLTGRKVKPKLAMTGEVTLRGDVLPIGGLKEKSLAAYRAGIEIVILPKDNQKDMVEIPKEIKDKVKFVFASTVDEVMEKALEKNKKRIS